MVAQLNATVEVLALTGLKDRHPSCSVAQLRRKLAELRLGSALADKVYGPLPNHE